MRLLNALFLARLPAFGLALLGLVWGAFSVQVPALMAALDVGEGVFGLLLMCSAPGLVAAMWLAPLVDRHLGAAARPISLATLGLALASVGLATNPVTFGCAMLFMGAASGLWDVLCNADASELESAHGQPLMNAVHGAYSAFYAVMALTAGLVRAAGVAPLPIFTATGLLLCIGTVIWMRAPSNKLRKTAAKAQEGPGLHWLPRGAVAFCGLIVCAAFMSEAAVESWSALYLEQSLGTGAAGSALGPALLGLTMAVGRFSGQVVIASLGERRVLWAGAGLAIAGTVLASAAPTVMVAYLGFAVFGLGVSVVGPIGIAMAGRLVLPSQRTGAVGQAAALGFAGFFVAPILMGGLAEQFGLSVAFASLVLWLAVVPLFDTLAQRRLREPAQG